MNAPAPIAATDWRALVREDLRICARDNGIIGMKDTLDAIPRHLQPIVVALEKELITEVQRMEPGQRALEFIRRTAWDELRKHRA